MAQYPPPPSYEASAPAYSPPRAAGPLDREGVPNNGYLSPQYQADGVSAPGGPQPGADEKKQPLMRQGSAQDMRRASIDDKLQRLRIVASRYDMAPGAVMRLRKLEGYDIVFIADDSSSMGEPAHAPKGPFDKVPTRWEELCSRVCAVIEIATCLDRDGIDIYFLNRPPARKIHDPEFARALFTEPPRGYTPLTAAYRQVLRDKLTSSERKVLVIIATDGEPNVTNGPGTMRNDVQGFHQLLLTRDGFDPAKSPTVIMACTDSEEEIGWLQALDDNAPHVDVVDDYEAERKEILAKQGANFHFTVGDYVAKTLLGSVDPLYDGLDEAKLSKQKLNEYMGVAAGNGASMRDLHAPGAAQNAPANQNQCCAVM